MLQRLRNVANELFNTSGPSKLTEDDGSIEVFDESVINEFVSDPENSFLVSFPRTGSHWLRILMELYFEHPSLVRIFFYPEKTDYLTLHTHDMDLDVERSRVLYLYREPVATIYSQLRYHEENIDDPERITHWSTLYGSHLDKWLHEESFTEQKTIIRYKGMKNDLEGEFEKICSHFSEPFDEHRFQEVTERVTRDLVKKKTQDNDRILNMDRDTYVEQRNYFRSKHGDLVWSTVLEGREHLRSAFTEAKH